MTRIMVIEDDATLSRVIRDNLVFKGFEVECLSDGIDALPRIRSFAPDLLLLDVMLPGLDGFEICRLNAESPFPVPTIILSARSQNMDKVRGLELGADDYLTKPFTLDELLARINALLRRTHRESHGLDLGAVHIDFSNFTATKGGACLSLTDREFAVLKVLASHPNQLVTREQLLRSAWGYSEAPMTRTVDYFIGRLRAKIEPDPRHPRYIHSIYGEGYRLTPNG
jgi:two-component system, OmpR family, response regulator VicR